MIKKTHKIKAFTLTEMMVVIVISAIVVGLAFTVLGIVQNNMRSIENNYEYQSKIQSLEVALTIDFTKYPVAEWNPKENELTLSSPIENRTYTFVSDSIVNDLDTFALKTKNVTYYFEGEEVKSGRIDAIKLTFNDTKDLHRIFVYKRNDPTIHF
ncbi:prepilin-type N-terminal cleavage/methylation domain-containing protein [Aquimarina sp. 2201CG14-23]|uniref:prepilin-type N-terminal cleavage/methylation domain-containing protein n=1 Tax=Aquimarina mycalae TaxID=3040073 RepID=UPI002477D5F2|nr:prepilin-type N-terminal cleavage/methylation domain-containing protein [Aquimarina sp. 2201CG14-23]MDH7445316.1 prepilin-type N-terminal cleavage/methylation domain-containing protein [Aquimarina sp. 2201CG14-23]